MILITPPEYQGQIVDVSFGWSDGGSLFMRTHDRSDGSIEWHRLRDPERTILAESDWAPQNGPPVVDDDAWEPWFDPDPVEAAERDLSVLEQFRDSRKP